MPIISGFENDIFISYAHKDNSEVAQEWVKEFYIYLKDMLIRSTGRSDIGIWWDDKKMDGNTYFDQSIKKGLDKTAIIICLHSPSYIQSEWCLKELDYFSEKAAQDDIGIQVGDDSRVVHVLLYNMDRDEWPEGFRGRTGISFYEAEDEMDLGDPLVLNSQAFHDQMKKLRNALLRLFKGFRRLGVVEKPAITETDTAKTDGVTIYFGDIPDSLGDRPRRIMTELEKKGFQIISDISQHDTAEHEKELKSALKKADLTVHFLDKYPGKSIPEEDGNWFRKKEVEMAMESEASQLIWMTSDFDFAEVEEEPYRQFLDDLEKGRISDKSYDFIRSVKGNVIKEVLGHADQLQIAEIGKEAAKQKINVLIDNHASDRDFAFDLNNLFSEHEITTFLTPMEDDPMNNNEKLRNYISKSRKFIFIYGKVKSEWLNARLTTALKILLDYGLSARDMIVYMLPPEKDSDTIKLKEQGIPIQIIDNRDDLLTNLTSNSNGQ